MAEENCKQHPDGPLDRKVDIDHLTDGARLNRQKLYERWKASGGSITTAAGQKLDFDLGREDENVNLSKLHWKVDGQVSVAKVSCQRCAEINSCREEGTPPFICLVRADDRYTRDGGTCSCAFCYCEGQTARCNAQKATSDRPAADMEEATSANRNHSARKNPRKRAQRLSSSSEEGSSEQEQTSSSSTESEGDFCDGSRSSSGRAIRPVNRYTGLGESIGSTSTSSTEFPIIMPQEKSQSKTPLRSANGKFASPNAPPTKQQKIDQVPRKSNGVDSQRAREIRQRCIKTASQLLSLELAELEAELGKNGE